MSGADGEGPVHAEPDAVATDPGLTSSGAVAGLVSSELEAAVALSLAWRRAFRVAAGLAVVAFIGLAVTGPRAYLYGEVVDENEALKMRLQDLDASMSEVDRILLRMRLYDAQVESLGTPRGDHGPLPGDVFANWRMRGQSEDLDDPLMGEPMDQVDPAIGPEDLRPAEAWALAVQGRADAFLSMVETTETDMTSLLEELEDLRALESALPTVWPTSGELTSGFGWRRSPVGRAYWRFHSGLDISARRGSPIVAPAPGRVIFSGWSGGYGRFVEIDHGYGITTSYGHCDRLHVAKGDEVQRGELLGTVGSTGRSTGPHLHFEVRLDDHPVDPLDYLPR